ncbi:MAG: response regulator [Lachnospiraceae bacterium]|nr:response regulator [Lachnospiraceae bacterium]
METQKKSGGRTIRFIIGSFFILVIISIGAFISLGRYMSVVTQKSVDEMGGLYMTGINAHITEHFRTLINLKLDQVETVVKVVAPDFDTKEKLYDELVYRSNARNFNYLALYSENGQFEMLSGESVTLDDPEPFYNSMLNNEKKVAVGTDESGDKIVMFGIQANYPMLSGEKSIAIVAAVPIDYISTMLSTEEEDALLTSHIIRHDGSFIVSDLGEEYSSYFDSLYDRYEHDDNKKIESYIQELSASMDRKESFSVKMDFDGSSQNIYCTLLPYSEWYLVTVLPYGILNETVDEMNRERTSATLLVSLIILLVLLIIFYFYYKMSQKQLRELEIARQDAMAATKAKSAFLSNMSHDIRTPMNAIVGMTAIATTHIDDKEYVRNCLKKITLSGKHLLGLINDVLDMSKIESGKMTLTEDRISLREVIEGIVGIVQTQIKAKSQNFNVHIDNISAEEVYCDSVRLNQVLLNLLSNAVKYTQEGGTIQLRLFQEEAPSEKGSNYIRTHIIVSDNGIGMTPEFLNQIFDSYSRADSKRVHKTEGAGLGMAITKYIVDAMKGTVTVQSEPNNGTTFHVILDLEKAPEQEINMVLPAWKMLVVDDDEILCRTAVDALQDIGIQADWTLSGEKALEMVKKHHLMRDDYQIVLLDWKLPGMDGLYVAKQIRQIIDVDMPIILISAYDWSEFEDEARAAGINGFISKPLFKSTLFHGLKKYMGVEDNIDEILSDSELSGRHVLVAEDNDLNWEILDELLSDMGMKLERAENGQMCLEKFNASDPGFYDVILMDVRMPIMNGYESTTALRALSRPDAQDIPIIAMTADAFSEDIKHCLECGMNAHTAKPINLDELLSLLKKYILR